MPDLPNITIDVRTFALVSAIDTCSVWNLLSSRRLLMAALAKQRWFLVADYVRYEALVRPRTRSTTGELTLQTEFRERLQQKRGFEAARISIADLLPIANLPEVRKLGRGEIATMALARKIRAGVLTDDQGARKAAPKVGAEPAQTTPQLFGWLLYEGALSDGDVSTVIAEHEDKVPANRGRLTCFLRAAHIEACRCRLLQTGPAPSSVNQRGLRPPP